MHLQQTKAGSLASGGPQYFFHGLTEAVRDFLRHKGARPVVLQTPYGIVETPYIALGKDHKLDKSGDVISGNAQHDRIQKGPKAKESIGEAIRRWYALKDADFERIDLDVEIHAGGHFIISPTKVSWRAGKRTQMLTQPTHHPLSFHRDEQSRLWREQIATALDGDEKQGVWVRDQICRVVEDHSRPGEKNILEFDVLRVTGALSKLGMHLGPLRMKHYDCDPSSFHFHGFQSYPCPVELKKRSSGFKYQELRYKPLPRVVVLCVEHDLRNLRQHVDVVELAALGEHLKKHA